RRSSAMALILHPRKGHESLQSTNIYLHADMTLKERALARTTPANARPGRYRPDPLCQPRVRQSDLPIQ
ncbi:MAG: hypothetical protein ACRD0Q_07205, partial [Acidimicrobiales bacterium]